MGRINIMNSKAFNGYNYYVFLDYAFLFRIKLIKEFLGDVNGKKIADVGCGGGYVSFLLWLLGAEVYSIDISKKLLQATSSLNKLNANFKPQLCRSDIANLPFKEGSFDVLCCLEVLEHLFDDEIAVEEIAKVTKSNGRVILSVPFNARSVTQKKNQRVRTLYKSYDFEALRKLFLNKPLRLERAIFWGFPILKIFDLMSLRKIFAVLGSMIRFFENEKFSGCDSLNNHGRCAFLDNLARFYYTRFWRGILLPLVLRLLHFDRIFQDLPLSHDVFLIFRKI